MIVINNNRQIHFKLNINLLFVQNVHNCLMFKPIILYEYDYYYITNNRQVQYKYEIDFMDRYLLYNIITLKWQNKIKKKLTITLKVISNR